MYISSLRELKGINQTQLSEELGVSLRTIQNWEQDAQKIPRRKAVVIAKYFNVSPESIYHEGEVLKRDKYIDRLEKIAANAPYSREEQKRHIHEIKMRTSTLPDAEKIDLLINELLLAEQKIINTREIFQTPPYEQFIELVKEKLGI